MLKNAQFKIIVIFFVVGIILIGTLGAFYIYSLENDSELAFRIENFKMVSGGSSTQASSSGTVTGTFSVNNVSIETETISSSDNGSSSSSTQRANNSESDSNINTEGQ